MNKKYEDIMKQFDSLLKNYILVDVMFRVTKDGDLFIITECFEDDFYVACGYSLNEQDLFESLLNDRDVSDFIQEEGYYEARILFEYDEGFYWVYMEADKLDMYGHDILSYQKLNNYDDLPF